MLGPLIQHDVDPGALRFVVARKELMIEMPVVTFVNFVNSVNFRWVELIRSNVHQLMIWIRRWLRCRRVLSVAGLEPHPEV